MPPVPCSSDGSKALRHVERELLDPLGKGVVDNMQALDARDVSLDALGGWPGVVLMREGQPVGAS